MNQNGNPLVQEVGLDLDTCLKTGRAVWTLGIRLSDLSDKYPLMAGKRKIKMYFAACPQIIAAASGVRPD